MRTITANMDNWSGTRGTITIWADGTFTIREGRKGDRFIMASKIITVPDDEHGAGFTAEEFRVFSSKADQAKGNDWAVVKGAANLGHARTLAWADQGSYQRDTYGVDVPREDEKYVAAARVLWNIT